VHFVGRLATYKYYNMDQIVAQALMTYSKIVGLKRKEAMAKATVVEKVFAAAHAPSASNGNGINLTTNSN
jgi:UDP-galactopyranose mutase